jgi:hypothetical protein
MTTSKPPVNIELPPLKYEITGDIALCWREAGDLLSGYPTDRMQKRLLMSSKDMLLDEEGTGFGVPIIKMKHETILPGSARIKSYENNGVRSLEAIYTLNLVKRKRVNGQSITSSSFYRLNESFASIHRNAPILRGIHTWLSHRLRDIGDFESYLSASETSFTVKVLYSILPNEAGRFLVHCFLPLICKCRYL